MSVTMKPKFSFRKPETHTAKKGLWEFLNSNFGLWLFSSIVLSGLTFSYTNYSSYVGQKAKEKEEITNLDIEIRNRLNVLAIALESRQERPKEFSAVVLSLANPARTDYPIHVFNEYKDMPTQGLLWKLHSLVQESEKYEIKNSAIAASKLFSEYAATRIYAQAKDDLKKPRSGIVGLLNGTLGDMTLMLNTDKFHSAIFSSTYTSLNLARWNYPFSGYLESSEAKKIKGVEKTQNGSITIEDIRDGVYAAVTEKMPDFTFVKEKDIYPLRKGNVSIDDDDNSLDFIEIIMDVEDRFNIEIPDKEAEAANTVGKLVSVVASIRGISEKPDSGKKASP